MKIRNQKSYIKSLPDGRPPVRTGVMLAPYVYLALLFLIVAYIVYFVTTNMLSVQAFGYVETEKYPMQAYEDGVLTEINYAKGETVTEGSAVFNMVFVPDGDNDGSALPIDVVDGKALASHDTMAAPTAASGDMPAMTAKKITLSDSPRMAPISGVVAKIARQKFEFVKQGDEVLELADPNSVKLKAFFDRTTLEHVTVGKEAEVVFEDGTRSTGMISAIGSAAKEHPDLLKKGYLPLEIYILVELTPAPGQEATWAEHDQLDARVKVNK